MKRRIYHTYNTKFFGLNFSEIIHYKTKRPIKFCDIKENACGVIHLSNIKWGDYHMMSADVQIYATPFSDLKAKKAQLKNYTLHKIMMTELGFFKNFERLKNKVCIDKG